MILLILTSIFSSHIQQIEKIISSFNKDEKVVLFENFSDTVDHYLFNTNTSQINLHLFLSLNTSTSLEPKELWHHDNIRNAIYEKFLRIAFKIDDKEIKNKLLVQLKQFKDFFANKELKILKENANKHVKTELTSEERKNMMQELEKNKKAQLESALWPKKNK